MTEFFTLSGFLHSLMTAIIFVVDLLIYEVIAFGIGGVCMIPALRSKKMSDETANAWIDSCVGIALCIFVLCIVMYGTDVFRPIPLSV